MENLRELKGHLVLACIARLKWLNSKEGAGATRHMCVAHKPLRWLMMRFNISREVSVRQGTVASNPCRIIAVTFYLGIRRQRGVWIGCCLVAVSTKVQLEVCTSSLPQRNGENRGCQ